MSVFSGLKRMLGQKEEPEAFIETRLDRFGTAGPPPPPPPPAPMTAGQPIATTDPLGTGLPPLAPPAPATTPAPPAGAPPFAPPAPIPAVEEDLSTRPDEQPVGRPKARPSGANVRLLMADGSSSELDDPELAARAEYLVRNLLNPKPPEPKS
ncbi:MAG: hypothetical protein M3161_01955 [Actinomycetota bacterium]|nr:hypothetical protein [Actinomycetota bacterium]